jgi:hypothetical protein
VPSGYHCNCAPYPQLSAQGLTAATEQTVKATNQAVTGYTTTNVLDQLNSDSTVIDQVRKADAVEIKRWCERCRLQQELVRDLG